MDNEEVKFDKIERVPGLLGVHMEEENGKRILKMAENFDVTDWKSADDFVSELNKVTENDEEFSREKLPVERGLRRFQRDVVDERRSSGSFIVKDRQKRIPPDNLRKAA